MILRPQIKTNKISKLYMRQKFFKCLKILQVNTSIIGDYLGDHIKVGGFFFQLLTFPHFFTMGIFYSQQIRQYTLIFLVGIFPAVKKTLMLNTIQ